MQHILDLSERELACKPDIKLVYFDIDGTLLDVEGNYSQRLRAELVRVQELGVKTAVASGRPQFACSFLFDGLKLTAPGVFCTGAHVFDPASGTSLRQACMDAARCDQLAQIIRKLDLYAELYTDLAFFLEPGNLGPVNQEHARQLRAQPVVQNFAEAIGSKPLLKWLLGAKPGTQSAALRALEQEFPDLHFAYSRFPRFPDWLFANVVDRSADKHQVFEWLMEYHCLQPEQIMSFGDSHSDLISLQLAGWGIAMGDAEDEIKQAARLVTDPASQDGVALALSRLI